MNILKFLSSIFSSFFRKGGYFKLRSSYKNNFNFKKLIFTAPLETSQLKPTESVVVVGTGIAALSVLKNIKQNNHTRVSIIIRDDAFGGKCVNYGCMPAEYFASKEYLSPNDKIKTGKDVIQKLRMVTEQSFKNLGFPLIRGEVKAVRDKKICLADGTQIDFDRLILATGNQILSPANLGEVTPLDRFWELEAKELVIVTDHNVSSLSYAFVAIDQGIKTTVVFTEKPAIEHLPSFQYFHKLLTRKGAKIFFEAKILQRIDQTLKLISNGKNIDVSFNKIIFNGTPTLNIPPIDDKNPDVFDVNFSTSSLSFRPDIYLVGDSSGMLAASEAEFQARALVDSWKKGNVIDMRSFEKLPFRLHGNPSLAMVGASWTLLKREWRSVDFKTLGWSLLHGEEGKLWYLYDQASDKVDAIHICHRNAADLISMASVLIDFPLNDSRWFSSSVHPSSFEIFKVLIEDVGDLKKGSMSLKEDPRGPILNLPPLSQFNQLAFFQQNFSEEERKMAILDSAPTRYLAILLGVKSISRESGSLTVVPSADGKYRLDNGMPLEYSFPDSSTVIVTMAGKSSTVNFAD